MPGSEPLTLRVEGLAIHGHDGRRLVEVPRLELPAGGTLAVKGPSGAGKSSLLHALAGLLRPTKGTDLAALPEAARARLRRERIGLVFQDFLLFEDLGAAGNAAIAAAFAPARERAAIRSRAEDWLGRLGQGGRTEPGVRTFSGGERQRVAVARALAHAPAVIVADEPTASPDRASADRLIDDLLEVVAADGCTLVAVNQEAHLARRLGGEVRLADGRVVEAALG